MSKELKTGIIAVLAIALFIWGFNFLKGQDIFDTGARKFYAEYNDIKGLNKSSFVTINGHKSGKISSIKFSKDPTKKGKIIVEFIVTEDFEFSKKSIAKIESAGLMGGQNLAIIPNYEGEIAKSGDLLKGAVQDDLLNSVENKLVPLQDKLNSVMANADALLKGLNEVLNKDARKSLNKSIIELEGTLSGVKKTLASVNGMLNKSKENIEVTLNNAKKITNDFSKVSNDLAGANLGKTVKKLETTLVKVNLLLSDVKSGKGTIGKLMTDDKMYTNLTNASKEIEELLRELKLNPKRFVHFSLFGKKAKSYSAENNKNNVSNKQ